MSAIYNELDPFAARWLRNLSSAGRIAPGVVDERSISDLAPADVAGHGQRHFFAGIGGWSLAARLAGVPDDADVWTGSCPCQGFSSAGRQRGFDDPRHLWPAWFRLISECRPAVVFGEQVASKLGWSWLDLVFADLEGAGYACAASDLPACSVGAPHRRQRLFFVAYADGESGRLLAAQRQPRRADAEARGGREAVGMAYAARHGRREGNNGAEAGAVRGHGASDGRRAIGVADADHAGLEVIGEQQARRQLEAAERSSAAGGMAMRGSSSGHVDWSDCDWLPCSDGVSRPVEPGTRPLASGIPGRVGLLRGYGNAFVPEVGAAFIAAALEAA